MGKTILFTSIFLKTPYVELKGADLEWELQCLAAALSTAPAHI